MQDRRFTRLLLPLWVHAKGKRLRLILPPALQ